MGRPRKDAGTPAAQERMREAFWSILERKPFARMTVKDVVDEAKVNRNTFYYHFDCIEDFAQACVRETLPEDIARGFIGGRRDPSFIKTFFGNSDETFRRLRLACSDQGSGVLGAYVREEIRSFWLEEFGIDEERLDPSDLIMTAFIAGGIVTVLGESHARNLSTEDLAAYISGPFAQTAMPAAIEELSRAARSSAQSAAPFPK